jgi:hypothetical protein
MLELIKGFVRYRLNQWIQNQDNNKKSKPETIAPAKVA